MKACVAYYRVSTRAQGRSGLGLGAQKQTVESYVANQGAHLVAEFEDLDSGSSTTRAGLQSALKLCKRIKATLVIAKLDRLSRSMSFVAQLMESGVEFVAADMPTANKLTIHIIAAMAEYERDLISQRTKQSLAVARARGKRLGNPSITAATRVGLAIRRRNADEFASNCMPAIQGARAAGCISLRQIARALNNAGMRTRRGHPWTAAAVRAVEARMANAP